jgi:hypothetical protein
MSDPIIVTVTVIDFNPNTNPPSATFTYSGTGVDAAGRITPQVGVVSVYTFTPAPGSPWTPAPPLTAAPEASWVQIDGWTMTVDGTHLGPGAAAGYRLSVVFQGVTYVDDPTILMVDPPQPLPVGSSERAVHKAV